MPNKWGEPLPWELAGMAHQEWLAVLRYTIKRWVASANALGALIEHGGSMTLEQWRALKSEHDSAEEEHRAVIRGDTAVCRKIVEKLDTEAAATDARRVSPPPQEHDRGR